MLTKLIIIHIIGKKKKIINSKCSIIYIANLQIKNCNSKLSIIYVNITNY
jgi:hypothetical protein